MKYKFGPAFIAGILALSSGVSSAEDRAQAQDRSEYVQTKLAEGIFSVAAAGVGQQKGREYADQKIDYLHRVDANEYSLQRMHDSDQPLTDWLEAKNPEWRRWYDQQRVLSSRISNANMKLRSISMSAHPELYAKVANDIRSMKGEISVVNTQLNILSRRNQALAIWARTGQNDIHLTDQERKAIKAYYNMRNKLISENKDLTKKAVVAELKSVATLVAYVPGVIVIGSSLREMTSSTKRMEKAQAESRSAASPAIHSQNVSSEAAR